MYATQLVVYELYHRVLSHHGERCFAEVLAPWLEEHPDERAWLAEVAGREQATWQPEDEELCRLYAFSRVNDLLLLSFQPPPPPGAWAGPSLALAEYVAFLHGLGMRTVDRSTFHPFFHEIVVAEPGEASAAPPDTPHTPAGSQAASLGAHHAPPDEAIDRPSAPREAARHEPLDGSLRARPGSPIEIVRTLWPCSMLGQLLFARAGVAVRAASRQLVPAIAERSTLYWAHRRSARPTMDLSVGWGHNSQWRTRFRRDYATSSTLCFNADGKCDAREPGTWSPELPRDDELSPEQRIELLIHRCFVRTPILDGDRWPWDERLTTSAPAG